MKKKTLRNVSDKLVLLNMNSYVWKVNVFCNVIADLGMLNAMLACRECVSGDYDEEAILLTSNPYPPFDSILSSRCWRDPSLHLVMIMRQVNLMKVKYGYESSLHKAPSIDMSVTQENSQPHFDVESFCTVQESNVIPNCCTRSYTVKGILGTRTNAVWVILRWPTKIFQFCWFSWQP